MNETAARWAPDSHTEQTYQAIREGFQTGGSGTTSIWWMLILVGSVVVMFAFAWFMRRQRELAAQKDFFERAMYDLGLNSGERALLRRLARLSGEAQPVALLLSPANLACGVRAVPMLIEDAVTRRQIQQLSRKLFGQTVELSTAEPAATEPATN
jgi:hypothetical protein